MTQLKPFYEEVQAHYDLSDDFFALFLDPSMTYSCAYFEREDMTLAEAQRAKIALSLDKCALRPGMRLLDIGCGWGAAMLTAAQQHGMHAIGLTLSRNQHAHVAQRIERSAFPRCSAAVRLQGWEEFDEPVDRIISIGAFEHFRRERYDDFFKKCRALLPADGRMMLHSILMVSRKRLAQLDLPLLHEHVLFAKFINEVIFPHGQLSDEETVAAHATRNGFRIEQTQSLQPHYARTLDCWAANLVARRDDAIAIAGRDTYDQYLRYLTGCADLFRSGHIDVMQFTLACS